MTRASRKRFLSRGPGIPVSDDKTLLSLVPGGETVQFERVRMLLTDIRLCELSAWMWVTTGDCNWPPLGEYRAAAEVEIRDAIARHVLSLTVMQVESSKEPSLLGRLCEAIDSLLVGRRHNDRPPLPTLSKAEQEADSILQALHF